MIGYSVNGFPRPVGSEFRQREIYAERGFKDDHPIPWVVSVVDTLAGPCIEAKAHINPQAIIATEVDKHSTFVMQDVIVKARDLLDQPGWTTCTVTACQVAGCGNPRPMWTAGWRNSGTECLPCSLRTVLACVECGAPDDAKVVAPHRERLLRGSLCFACDLWTGRIGQSDNVVANGRVYGIGDGRGSKESKGFAGAEWVVTFTDCRVVETDDLWDGGEVPEWFADRFPVNATVERKARP